MKFSNVFTGVVGLSMLLVSNAYKITLLEGESANVGETDNLRVGRELSTKHSNAFCDSDKSTTLIGQGQATDVSCEWSHSIWSEMTINWSVYTTNNAAFSTALYVSDNSYWQSGIPKRSTPAGTAKVTGTYSESLPYSDAFIVFTYDYSHFKVTCEAPQCDLHIEVTHRGTNKNQESAEEAAKMAVGILIAIIVGSVIGLAGCIAACVFCCKQDGANSRSNRQPTQQVVMSPQQQQGGQQFTNVAMAPQQLQGQQYGNVVMVPQQQQFANGAVHQQQQPKPEY